MAVLSHETRPARASRGRLLPLAGATIAIALLACACGGGSSPSGVAQVASNPTSSTGTTTDGTSTTASPAAYSSCMRAHGVTNFPDPDAQGNIKIVGGQTASGLKTGVDPNSPVFGKAQRACKALQPDGGKPDPAAQAKFVKSMLAFARCMRTHGVSKFPDPKVSADGAGVSQTIGPKSGVDPSSPIFQAAQKTCQALQGGDGPLTTDGPGPSAGAGPNAGSGPSSGSSSAP